MSHIVIDARLYGPKHTGIGRYTKNLLCALNKISPPHSDLKFTVITSPNLYDQVCQDLPGFQVIAADIPHYSISEQIKLPALLKSLKPDLVHSTHFNKSLLYFGKSVVTIHDLIMNFFKGKDTTTHNSLLYWPKYLAYRFLVFLVIKTSKIIVPSNFWRDYLISNYSVLPDDIVTTYEAVDPKFLTINSEDQKIRRSEEQYILYTGNLYPHKNIKIIFEALKQIPDLNLKIISARSDAFAQRAQNLVNKYNLGNQVEFLGYVADADFPALYANALALVHPSFMEGFSLTGLEAMALNCPVIASNTSCLPEIYQDSVLYFNPDDSSQLVSQINQLRSSPSLRKELITKGKQQLQKFSWDKTATETLDFYLRILQK